MLFNGPIDYHLLKDNFTGFPRMYEVEQMFSKDREDDIAGAVAREVARMDLPDIAGKRIAITAGSRGIPNCPETIAAIGRELAARGARPFVITAMGSHGNGTPEGQKGVLKAYGMTEETLGMPIEATMDTVMLGMSDRGAEAHIDRIAYEADGIVVCGRVKPHTDFRAPIESGICKMMVVGMGNHHGAIAFHKTGTGDMGERLVSTAKVILAKAKILFAVALIDNAYHGTKRIEAVRPEEILTREPELLKEAAAAMPCIHFKDIDTLVVDQYGKEISGAGMDPNVTGRSLFAPQLRDPDRPYPKKIAVMRLTEESHGNATGLGIADYISMKFAKAIDLGVTYTNSLSSTLSLGKIPMIMNSDLDTIYAAASVCGKANIKDVRIVRIKNTLELDRIFVSENYAEEIKNRSDVRLISGPTELPFGPDGDLTDL